jgi:hypothetical protein
MQTATSTAASVKHLHTWVALWSMTGALATASADSESARSFFAKRKRSETAR